MLFYLLLGLFIWFIVVPLVRVGFTINRARKQARDFFTSMGGGQAWGTDKNARNTGKDKNTKPEPKKKKIDSSIAETVEFEEIACNVTTVSDAEGTQTTTTYTRTEAQITDVEWEDV